MKKKTIDWRDGTLLIAFNTCALIVIIACFTNAVWVDLLAILGLFIIYVFAVTDLECPRLIDAEKPREEYY